ncbi:hypothetical protein LQW54_004169 [Pestalotiopsis sp. IQ-011]
MPTMKILICGGGIAGNALAFWLSKVGYDVTVIERFDSLRASGLQIDLRGPGIEVMKRMGLEEEFRAKAVQEEGMEIVDGSGKQRALFTVNRTGKGLQNFTTDFEMMRGDLCRLIYDNTKDRVKYLFGSTVQSFEDTGDSVKVLFSDGREDQFDLLVGADGQGSRTRKMMFGADTNDTYHSLDVSIGYYTVPRPISPGEQYYLSAYFAPGKRFVFTRRSDPHLMQVYLACKSDANRMKNVRKGDVEGEKESLTDIFRGAGWKTEQLLKALETSEDFYCERLAVVKLDAWSRGRAVLIGDSAYCPSATTGMGTTSSMAGAYILAGEIAKHCGRPKTSGVNGSPNIKDGLSIALKSYEDKFRPFMSQVQTGLIEGQTVWDKIPSSPWGIAIMNILLGIVALLRLNVIGRWILREDVKQWTLPTYKELM